MLVAPLAVVQPAFFRAVTAVTSTGRAVGAPRAAGCVALLPMQNADDCSGTASADSVWRGAGQTWPASGRDEKLLDVVSDTLKNGRF